MVIKINQPSTPFTVSEWYEYYFKRTKKNTKQLCILRECFKHFELNYPFLDESQHWGKVYQLLGIPHICGKVNKSKLRDMYLKEKKNKFNRLNKLNVDVKKIEKKGNKDYRAIIRRNRIINKPNVSDDQKLSDLENKKNNLIDNYELNSNTDRDTNNLAIFKKKVRFDNVRVLCYQPTSSESDTEYSPSLYSRKQKIINNKTEIHEPYFEKLNDSQSTTSVSDNEGNDNDTGITSFSSSEDVNSQVENHSHNGMDQEKINECSQDNIVPGNISMSENVDQPLNESEEILSDIVENDYDTGIMSPLPCSMENINETSSDNVNDNEEVNISSPNSSREEENIRLSNSSREEENNIRLSNSSREEENIRLSNSSSREEENIRLSNSSREEEEEEILCSQGDEIEYREIKIAREHIKRKPKLLTDLNENENINTEHDNISTTSNVFPLSTEIKKNFFIITHATNLEEASLTDLNIKTLKETQNSKEISSMPQKTKEPIEKEKSVILMNKFNSKKPNMANEKSSLVVDDDNDDFHEQYLTDTSHIDAEQVVTFIPSGNLVYQKIDHLEDYKLSSFSSNESIGTSLLQKYLGFGNISTNNNNIEYSAYEEIEAQNSNNDSIVTGSPVKGQEKLSSLESSIHPPNDKENQDKNEINTNTNESLKTKISLDSNKENQRNYLDSSAEVIPNTESSNSEIREQTDKILASTKREPLKLLSDTSLLNRLTNRIVSLRNEAFKDKENEILTLTNQALKTKNQNLQKKKENLKITSTIVPKQLTQDKNESSSSEILPPSNNTDKEEANTLQEKIRSMYTSKFQLGINILKEYKEKELLRNIRDENLNFNSGVSLLSEHKKIIATKSDKNMSSEMSVKMTKSKEVKEDVKNKDSSFNSSIGSLPTEKVSHGTSESEENINSQNQPVTNQLVKGHSTRVFIENKNESLEEGDNSLQLQARYWKGNIFQAGNDKIDDYKDYNDPECTELYTNVSILSLTDSTEENQDFDKENKAPNQLRRKSSLIKKNRFSDYEENYADSSSNDNNESIELLHKKVKRRRKKPTGISRIKNISYDNDKSPEVTSDDMELIQEIQDSINKFRVETIPFKKTTTTTKIMIRQNVREINDSRSTDDTKDLEEFRGGQRTTQESEMKMKTSIVKQPMSNVSSDTSTTGEFVSSALARRIFYLNNP